MGLTERVASYVSEAGHRSLPGQVVEATKHHVLDTIAAIISGSRLPAGQAGLGFASQHGRPGGATLVTRGMELSPEYAALANAMAAHADESDDTHELSKSHPGCSIVPTAFAAAEETNPTGERFLRAVAAGYDIGPRVNMAAWPSFADVRKERRGTPGISGTFGSASAAAVLHGLDQPRVQVLLSYVAQQVGGMNTWKRDVEHVEKAYVLAGWPAFCATFAISLIKAGWTGVVDVFDGDPNFLEIVGNNPEPERMVEGLGSRFEVQRTHIKMHAVGSPAQAPIQALLHLMNSHQLNADSIERVRVTLPSVLAHTVQPTRTMPNINLAYLLAIVVADGAFSYSAAHDLERFEIWRGEGDGRIEVIPDETMEPRRQALVEVEDIRGSVFSHKVSMVRGSPDNPMTSDEVREKAIRLMTPVVGVTRATEIASMVAVLDEAETVGPLMEVLAPEPG